MDSRWFVEDREDARKDKSASVEELKKESLKALKNSTLFSRRLDRILDGLIEESNRDDDDFSKPDWERIHVANISRRKTLREIKKLIQL
jgi:hypothetical protein